MKDFFTEEDSDLVGVSSGMVLHVEDNKIDLSYLKQVGISLEKANQIIREQSKVLYSKNEGPDYGWSEEYFDGDTITARLICVEPIIDNEARILRDLIELGKSAKLSPRAQVIVDRARKLLGVE